MNIGVISDTHIPYRAGALPSIVLQYFKSADHIIHAGDIDPPELHEIYGEKKLVTLCSFTFGVIHGYGAKGRTIDSAADAFSGDNPDCIIFGHSHIPFCGYYRDILMFNPGSPIDKRRNKYYSFGVIEVNEMVTPHIIYFDNNGAAISQDFTG